MATAIDTSKETHADVAAAEVLRRFVGYYKPYKALFFADLVAACILAGVDLAFPQLLNFFTREFFTESPSVILGSLGLIALLFIALYAARTGCQWFITYWGHVMGARMEADMRRDLFEQYQRLSFGYYDRHNTGVMMSKITTDLFDISELAHHGPENLFICTLKIVGSFVLLFMINGPLTAIMLVVTIVMAALSFALNYWRRRIFRENRERMAGINAAVQDSLGGIRVVKSFGGEDAEREKFRAANEAFLDTKNRSYKFMGAFHGLNSLFTGLLYTIVVVGGGYFVAAGTLAVTDLAIYALYVGIFMAPVEQLINFTETLQKGYAGFRRFIEVLAERPDVATASVMEGDVVLMIDNTPSVMLFPCTIFRFAEEINDYYFPPLVGSYLQIVRMIVLLLTLFVTPLWYLLVKDPAGLHESLHFLLIEDEYYVPLILQLLLVELIIDVLKLASLNTPDALSNSFSMLGALILGDFAVQARWLVPEVLVYMAFVAIANYAQHSYEMGYAVKLCRMALLILIYFFDWWGFIGGIIGVVALIASTRPLVGKGYLYPLIPFNGRDLRSLLHRRPISRDNT